VNPYVNRRLLKMKRLIAVQPAQREQVARRDSETWCGYDAGVIRHVIANAVRGTEQPGGGAGKLERKEGLKLLGGAYDADLDARPN
jgi:hypothetical protein